MVWVNVAARLSVHYNKAGSPETGSESWIVKLLLAM